MFSCTSKRLRLGTQQGSPDRYSYFLCGSRGSLGDKAKVGPELIRPNQVVNSMRGLWRRGSEMKVKFCSMCVDASTWSMVAILGLRRIRVKGKIVRICDWNTS